MQQKILIGLALTLIMVIFIPVYWAMESGRQDRALERQEGEARERGAQTYAANCAVCHGAEGTGNIAPALKGTRLDADALMKIITSGVAGTAMPPFGVEDDGPLKEHQIKDLVAFIQGWDQSLLESASAAPEVAEVTTAVETTTASSVDAAGLYAEKCAVCHGKNREGVSGLAPALTPQSLAAFSEAIIRDAILNGRSGTAMPVFKGVLSAEQIDALLQFIKNTPH